MCGRCSTFVIVLGVVAMAHSGERRALCTVYRPTDMERARSNIGRQAWAREVRDGVLDRCRKYYAFPPDRLAALVPEKTPLVSGHCPQCGAHFASAEILDHGDTLRCTGCQHTWRCDNPDRSEKWDVYGAMRSFRLRYLYLHFDSLGLAYQLTGDKAYARRAAAVIKKFARVFKGYRMNAIHRNCWLDRPDPYYGRIDGWKFRDGLCVSKMLVTYDLVRDSGAFDKKELAFIDENLVRHAMNYFIESFRGKGYLSCGAVQDMGHSWESVALAGAILDDPKVLGSLNQLFRDLCRGEKQLVFFPEDGAFVQGTPDYASQLLSPLTKVAEILRGRPGFDVYLDPACRLLSKVYTWPLETTYPNGLPAAINDSHVGSNWSGTYSLIAYYRFGDRRALTRLREHFGTDFASGSLFSLFNRPPEGGPAERGTPYGEACHLLEGLRLAVLRHGSPKTRQTMAFLDYGRPMGHHHDDFLNVGLWAKGMLMVTEMGYRWSLRDWSRSALAHNLVLELGGDSAADARQTIWYPGPQIQAVEAGTPGLRGRRFLGLVSLGEEDCYLLDLFWAAAGKGVHTWVMHAASNAMETSGLAGLEGTDDVAQAFPNAAEIVADPLRRRRQTTTDADIAVTWRFADERALRTNLLGGPPSTVVLAECPSEEDYAVKAFTDAGIRRNEVPFPYRGLIQVRREEAESCFAAVHEPFRGQRTLTHVGPIEIEQGEGVAVQISFARGSRRFQDVLLHCKPGLPGPLVARGLVLEGRAALVRFAVDHEERKPVFAVLMSGRHLKAGSVELKLDTSGNAAWPPSE